MTENNTTVVKVFVSLNVFVRVVMYSNNGCRYGTRVPYIAIHMNRLGTRNRILLLCFMVLVFQSSNIYIFQYYGNCSFKISNKHPV